MSKLEKSWDWKVCENRSMLSKHTYDLHTGPAETWEGVVATPWGYCLVYAEKGYSNFRKISHGRERCWRKEWPTDVLPSKRALAVIAGRLMRGNA